MLSWPSLRIPSTGADPAHAGDVAAAGTWACDLIRRAGGSAELVDSPGQPLAIGELRASRDPGNAPTVLGDGRFDVQPPDLLDLWVGAVRARDPRRVPVRPWVAGDQGQLCLLLSAARELARAGQPPVNVRFTGDGVPETGGDSLLALPAADERGADAAVISTPRWSPAGCRGRRVHRAEARNTPIWRVSGPGRWERGDPGAQPLVTRPSASAPSPLSHIGGGRGRRSDAAD